jgi:hypothetical protein
MRQAIHQHRIVTYAISLGLMTTYMSLFQPIPSASAQQLTGTVSQGTSGTGTQGRRIENMAPTLLYPTKSLEKKDAKTLTRKLHRLIRKPQNTPVASVEPSPSGFSPVSSSPTPPSSLQSGNTTSQSKEPSSLSSSVGAAVPLATMSIAPSSATATGSIAAGTASTGTLPLAAAGAGNSSTSGIVFGGGRTMSRLAAEMPGLIQLLSPPSASAPTTSSATLTWAPNIESTLAGYKIYRATASGAYGAALAIVPAGTVTYQATRLSGNTTYFFVITAYNSAGNESLFSNEVSKSIF